ncbi:MAG: hypothetical protein LBD67_02070 [Candidatus Accumulibacter sp.]|nr:hypothetical protein [Accumulibacter sp.]
MKNEPSSSSEGDRANGLERNSSTGFLRQAQDGAGRTDWKGILRQASFVKLRTERGERIEKTFSSQASLGLEMP